jgi:hypothetical protein
VLRTVVLSVFMIVWGAVTFVVVVKNGTVPPEYWAIPAIGIGGILGVMTGYERTQRDNGRSRDEQSSNSSESSS